MSQNYKIRITKLENLFLGITHFARNQNFHKNNFFSPDTQVKGATLNLLHIRSTI